MTTTIGFVLAGAVGAVGLGLFAVLAPRVLLTRQPDEPEVAVQDLELGKARWWEVAGTAVVLVGMALVEWALSRWDRRRGRVAPMVCPGCGETREVCQDMTWRHCSRCGIAWR